MLGTHPSTAVDANGVGDETKKVMWQNSWELTSKVFHSCIIGVGFTHKAMTQNLRWTAGKTSAKYSFQWQVVNVSLRTSGSILALAS